MTRLFRNTVISKATVLLFFLIAQPGFVKTGFAQTKTTLALSYEEKRLPYGLTEKTAAQQPKVALVLSGGGARGLSQVGALKALNEYSIPFDHIVATSMGSIIGGLYSAGYDIGELDSVVRTTPWKDFLAMGKESDRNELFVDQKITEDRAILALRLEGLHPVLPTSINNGQRLSGYLNLLALNAPIHVNQNFSELKYNYKAVCTDLITGNPVVLDHGSLSLAMRASAGVSLLISPVRYDSLLLVDGGLVANIPVQLAKESGSDYVIVFNTTSPLNSEDELDLPWNVADQLVSIPMRLLSTQQLRLANVVIEPQIGRKKNNDFTGIDSLIEAGYVSTVEHIGKMQTEICSMFKSKLKEKEFFIRGFSFDADAPPEFASMISKYSLQDSLSSHDILNDLYRIHLKGDYDSLAVNITQDDSAGSHIGFFVKKFPQVKSIRIYGVNLIDQGVLDSVFEPLKFKPFNSKRVMNKIVCLMKIYRQKGYSLAEIEQLGFDGKDGVLFIKITEGVVSKIIISGNKKTKTEIIQREFPMKEGEYFSYQKFEQGLMNLRSTNLFNDINLTVNNSNDENIINLRVVEKPSNLLRMGIRVDNENQMQISLDMRDENLMGSATELGLIASGGARNRSFIAEHKANRIFDTYFTYKIRGFYEFNDVYTYVEDTTAAENAFRRKESGEYRQIYSGVSLGLGAQVRRFGNLILEGKYQTNEVKNKHDYSNETYKLSITSMQITSLIDSQDKYPFPENGFNIKSYYETAQKLFGGDVSYTKFSLDYTSHFTFISGHTITPRFMIGFADNTLPLSQQFSLGGQNSFFGLRDNEFRGRQIFLSSLQYRYKLPFVLFFDTYVCLRYDLGSVWSTREHIRFKDLRHGAGYTISFDTPLGPADFSAGRSFLFKEKNNTQRLVLGDTFFYFTIGYYY